MDTQPPQPGDSGSKSGKLAGDTFNAAIIGTQKEPKHQVIRRDTGYAATKHMIQDAHLNVVCKTGSSKNTMQHAVGCKHIHIKVNGRQWII